MDEPDQQQVLTLKKWTRQFTLLHTYLVCLELIIILFNILRLVNKLGTCHFADIVGPDIAWVVVPELNKEFKGLKSMEWRIAKVHHHSKG